MVRKAEVSIGILIAIIIAVALVWAALALFFDTKDPIEEDIKGYIENCSQGVLGSDCVSSCDTKLGEILIKDPKTGERKHRSCPKEEPYCCVVPEEVMV